MPAASLIASISGADVADTMTAAERLRTTISALHVTADECLRVADSHVHQATQQGRNTVVG